MKESNMNPSKKSIKIDFYQKRKVVDNAFIFEIVKLICQKEKIKRPISLDVALVSDLEIQELNRRYRKKNRPTDVLAFENVKTKIAWPLEEGRYLGEVIISYQTARKQAAQKKISQQNEIAFLFIHGFLHLIGYDHEMSEKEAKRMEKKSKFIYNGYIASSRKEKNRAKSEQNENN